MYVGPGIVYPWKLMSFRRIDRSVSCFCCTADKVDVAVVVVAIALVRQCWYCYVVLAISE